MIKEGMLVRLKFTDFNNYEGTYLITKVNESALMYKCYLLPKFNINPKAHPKGSNIAAFLLKANNDDNMKWYIVKSSFENWFKRS